MCDFVMTSVIRLAFHVIVFWCVHAVDLATDGVSDRDGKFVRKKNLENRKSLNFRS